MRFLFAFLFVFAGHCLAAASSGSCEGAVVRNGVVDLTCWQRDSVLNLTGDWRLVMQDNAKPLSYNSIKAVPGLWRRLGPVEGQSFSGTGRGKYSLTFHGNEIYEHMVLKLPQLNGARRVSFTSADGTESVLFDSGHVDAADAQVTPLRNYPIVLPAIEHGAQLHIEINYTSSRNGGLPRAPYIGDSIQVHSVHGQARSLTVATAALLFIFAMLNFGLYPGQHRVSALFLGLTALAVSTRILFVDSEIVFDFLPNMTVRQYDYVGWLTFFGFTVFGLAYYYTQYPRLVPRWLFYPMIIFSVIGLIFLLFTPHTSLQAYGDFYRIFIGFSTAMLVGSLIKGIRTGSGRLRLSVLNGVVVALFYAAIILQYQLTSAVYTELYHYAIWVFFIGFETLLMGADYRRSLIVLSNLSLQNKQLKGLVHQDDLTGLANRRAFEEKCQYVGETLDAQTGRFFVAVIDLDRFKEVNDTHGHHAGDDVLRKVASVLMDNVRAVDFVARWGGEEFCILLNHVNKRSAVKALERIRKEIEKAVISFSEQDIKVTASIGVSMFGRNSDTSNVFREADSALYISKQKGRNRLTCAWEKDA